MKLNDTTPEKSKKNIHVCMFCAYKESLDDVKKFTFL